MAKKSSAGGFAPPESSAQEPPWIGLSGNIDFAWSFLVQVIANLTQRSVLLSFKDFSPARDRALL